MKNKIYLSTIKNVDEILEIETINSLKSILIRKINEKPFTFDVLKEKSFFKGKKKIISVINKFVGEDYLEEFETNFFKIKKKKFVLKKSIDDLSTLIYYLELGGKNSIVDIDKLFGLTSFKGVGVIRGMIKRCISNKSYVFIDDSRIKILEIPLSKEFRNSPNKNIAVDKIFKNKIFKNKSSHEILDIINKPEFKNYLI